jgi:NSS family neurotransmitter:Na+ symporter
MVTLVVAKGVEEGVEKWVSQLMPLFIMLLLVVTWLSLSLPTSKEALKFFLYPNFSTLKLTSLSDAIGHSLFTLSVGFGTMVTFGSYLKKKVYVPGAGFRVATLDSLTAIFAGIIIFPMVLSSEVPAEGPHLLFQTVPKLFSQMQGGKFWGVVFFLCLYLAALGASIGILETIVSNMKVQRKIAREKSAWIAGGICFLLSLLPAFSSSTFKTFFIFGKPLFEFIDLFLVNWLVPITALVVGQIVIYRLPSAKKIDEFKQEDFPRYVMLYKHWLIAMKYIVPGLIVSAFLMQIVSFFI